MDQRESATSREAPLGSGPTFLPGRFSPTSAFRYPEFRLLWGGALLANVGNWMQQFALGWLIVELAVRAGSPELVAFYLGLVGLARSIPALVFGLIGGVYADRVDRRALLLVTRLAAAGTASLLAALTFSGLISIPLVMVLSAVSTAIFGFDAPGRISLLPVIVGVRELFNANGVMRAAQQTAILVGPLVAGFLIGPFGVAVALLIIAVMYIASFVLVVFMTPRAIEPHAKRANVLRAFRDGIRYTKAEPVVGALLLFGVFFGMFAQSYVQLLPAVAHETLQVGAVELSWIAGAAGAGALLGAFFAGAAGSVQRRGLLLIAVSFMAGAVLVVFGLQRALAPTIVVSGILGCTVLTVLGSQSNLIQMYVPDQLRGRITGLMVALIHASAPLGTLVIGTLGTFIGVSNALVVSGAVVIVGALAILLWVGPLRRAGDVTTGASVAGA